MNIPQAEAELYQELLAEIGSLYNGTCDITQVTQTTEDRKSVV